MERQYFYITGDGGDGSAYTLWFADRATWLLWFELNNYRYQTLDDGFIIVEGKINEAFITTEMDVRERFMEEE